MAAQRRQANARELAVDGMRTGRPLPFRIVSQYFRDTRQVNVRYDARMKPPNGPRESTTPLQRAKSYERVATLSITMIVGVAATIVIPAMMATGGKPAVQQHLISIIGTFTQFIVSLATLALIGSQVSVAVGQIEQAEQSEASILQLTAAVHRMVGIESLPRGIRQSPRHADASRRTTRP